jgi:predicted TIM-barrel fold metal-dependent hydrolase
MIIDVHVHPIYFKPICSNLKINKFRSDQFGIYKQSAYDMDEVFMEMQFGQIDKAVLLPLDLTTSAGDMVVSNEEVQSLVRLYPNKFIGFASVDPHRTDALEILDYAFKDLGLKGLKLNPSKQRFYPADEFLKPIYQKCLQYNRPILFHSGMSWEPNAPTSFSQPLNFEDIAINFPDLRFCLAHFGWPWVQETVMLLIKYPNIYTDTSLLYMDSPEDFFNQVFTKNIGPLWVERNFHRQVMFGSNTPRFRAFKLKSALEQLDLRKQTLDQVLGLNALNFLGLEDEFHG